MSYDFRSDGTYGAQQQRRPSPSARHDYAQNDNYNRNRNLLQQLDNFIHHLNGQPSAIPEEQNRLSVLIPALSSDAEFCTVVCRRLWQFCLNGVATQHQNYDSGDQRTPSLMLSTYDFARICSVLAEATSLSSADGNRDSTLFFNALKQLCSDSYEEYVKPFLERHDTPQKPVSKDRLKLVLQVDADLISQMDSLPLLKSAMQILINACYSIVHIDDRRRDPQALSEELLLAATTSVLRVAGPKIDDPTIVAHLIKTYPQVIPGLLNLWEEIFRQVRAILVGANVASFNNNTPHQYSVRVKNQLLALLEARAGYWGMLSSQYAAMQACATAFVAGDPQMYGAACAEYYTTFGDGLAMLPQQELGTSGGGVESDSAAYNLYAGENNSNYVNRPATLTTGVPANELAQQNPADAEYNKDFMQYLSQTGQQVLLAEMVDGVPEEDLDAEHAKFERGEGVYSGYELQQQQQSAYANDVALGINTISLTNGTHRKEKNNGGSGEPSHVG